MQKHFVRNIRAEFGIPNLPQSSDFGKNSDGAIFDFQISGQSLLKENCHNSRSSDDIDIKLGPITKIDNKNKTTSTKLTMTSCWRIVIT